MLTKEDINEVSASIVKQTEYLLHISELPDSDAGVVPDTFAMRFSRV